MSFRIIQQESVALVSDMAPTEQNWWLRALVVGDAYGAIQLRSWGAPKSVVDKLVAAGHVVTEGEWAWLTEFELTQTPKSLRARPARCSPIRPGEAISTADITKLGRPSLTFDDFITPGPGRFVVPDELAAENVVAPFVDKHSQLEHDIVTVFEHWAKVEEATGGIKGAKLTAGRRSRIKARLDEGYTVDQLKAAVDGFLHDDFYLGKEKGKPKRYTGIDTIFANGERVERGGAMAAKRSASTAPDRFAAYDGVGR